MVQRLRTMPVRASAVATGHMAASVVRDLVSTLVVLLVAVGWAPGPRRGRWSGRERSRCWPGTSWR
ncbi:hypothetical protein [Nocardiopsis alborubida]|uniref:Uncharacterized protein n=1 Tax=Nocardiopsis alborubida TaxID=146802 RepID=A0A7X6RQH8_9ACTN|nr:hypothetical protein [Nocardiopsis alborubida]NKY98678.1 hypothetical protein [Nocardiopsis alborubida]